MASQQSKSSEQLSKPSQQPSKPSQQQSRPSQQPSGPTRHLEIETKLEVGPDVALPQLAGRRSLVAVGLAAAADPVIHELDAVYFDTSELDLLHSKLTLRHRTGGDDAGWHLKLPAIAGARTEVGLPLEPDQADPLVARVPAALADLVQGAARGRALEPVARIRNRRTVRRLLDPDGAPMVEVADDQVSSTRLLASRPESSTAADRREYVESQPTNWRELEVEILAGNRDQLAAVVTLLKAAGAKPAASASKLARALDDGGPAAGNAKSKGAGPAMIGAIAKLRDNLIRTDRALREGTPDALHDARASARRLRSVLAVYSPLFVTGATRSLRGGLQEFGAVLGRARDLEVLRARLDGQLIDEPEEYAAAARSRLDDEFARALPAALADVAELIRTPEYLQLLRDLDAFIATPPFSRRAGKPATTELGTHVTTAWRSLASLVGQALADPFGSPVLHDVRKGAKALRYAAEAAGVTLGENMVVFAAAIEEIQEVLGEHQDALSAAAWLAELARHPDTDGMSGFVFGRLHAFEQAVAAGTLDDFSDAWDRVEDGELLTEAIGS